MLSPRANRKELQLGTIRYKKLLYSKAAELEKEVAKVMEVITMVLDFLLTTKKEWLMKLKFLSGNLRENYHIISWYKKKEPIG